MNKQLNLEITINDDEFDVVVYEPESGEVSTFSFPYELGEHPEFNEAIGEEIYSWVQLWKDEE